MKLIIQVPCLNEEKTLPATLADLPRSIPGIDVVEVQVIDDGSADRTAEVARQAGVKHMIRFKHNKGLAAAFKAGVDNALAQGADILVNTDADNQYKGSDIPRLVQPILDGSADMVIGCRPIDNHPEFSLFKKLLQKMGSWVLRSVSGTTVKDAASGFRAYNREALLHINVFSTFSYCMETLIQAGYNNLKIATVDIGVNRKTRESRLFRNVFAYLWKSGKTILDIGILYRSRYFFSLISLFFLLVSLILTVRYVVLVSFYGAPGGTFWPTVILAGISLLASFFVYLTGVLSSLIAANRKLEEELLYKLRKLHNELEALKRNRQETT